MTAGRELFIADSREALATEAARRFIELAGAAIRERGRFAVALSGGSTPRQLYALLSQSAYRQAIDWSRVHLFFADERFVPHTDPESTARLVQETLLAGAPVPVEQVYPMPTAGGSPEACAGAYAATLAACLGAPAPVLDLALLGMGPDGHTASLFPGRPDYPGLVAAVHDSPKPPPVRLTLTLAMLNRARHSLFLVTGADKADALRAAFSARPDDPAALPAGRVITANGRSDWLIDRAAGAGLADPAAS